MAEIGNRKERLRVREAGASAAGRGQRPYASFPDRQPNVTPTNQKTEFQSRTRSILQLKRVRAQIRGFMPFSFRNHRKIKKIGNPRSGISDFLYT